MGMGYRCKNPLQLLSSDEVERIHQETLGVLKDCGLRFEDDEALRILSGAGCEVDTEAMRVRFPSQVVEECLKRRPDVFYLKGRNAKYDLKFSGEEVYFTNLAIQRILDSDTGKARMATLEDVAKMVTLIDALEDYHTCFEACPGVLSDKPAGVASLWVAAAMFRNTEKSTIGSSLSTDYPKWIIRMAEVVGEKVKGGGSSSSPLVYGKAACRGIIEYARAGHAVSVGSGIGMGATGPVTIAGTLVLQSAEILAGLALTQFVNPGVGVFYGSAGMPMDMRSGRLAGGAIERGILTVASAQVARFYGVPSWAPFPKTTSNSPDQQCGYEKATQLVLAALAGVSYNASGGGVTDGSLISFEQLVIDNEMYGMVGRLLEGVRVDEMSLAVDLIKEVGPIPGNFLNKRHTRDLWKREHYVPRLSSRISRTNWEREGSKDVVERAREKAREILETHQPVPLAEEVDRELDNILKAAEKEILGG